MGFKMKLRFNLKIDMLLFFVGFFLLQVAETFVNVEFFQNKLTSINTLGLVLLAGCIILNIKNMKFQKKQLALIFFLFVMSIVLYIKYSNGIFLETLLLIIIVLKNEFKKIVKIDFYIKLLVLILILTFNYLGLTNGVFETMLRGNVLRSSLGFYHPNTFAMFLMILCFEFMYISSEQKKLKTLIIIFLIALIIEKIPVSRTCVYCVAVLVFFQLFKDKFEKLLNSKILLIVSKNLYLVFLIVTLLLTYLYSINNSFAVSINEFISNRLYYQSFFLENYSINLFGNDVNYVSTLDNGYLKILLNFGIITTIFFMILYSKNISRAFKEKDYTVLVIYIIVMFYCLSESYLFYISYNIFLIYFFCQKKLEVNNNEIINNNTNI